MALRFPPIFARFADVAARLPKNVSPSNVLLTPDLRATLPATFLHQLQVGLAQSLFWVYALMFALAVLGSATMIFLPGGRADKYSYQSAQQTSAVETADHADSQSEESAPVFH